MKEPSYSNEVEKLPSKIVFPIHHNHGRCSRNFEAEVKKAASLCVKDIFEKRINDPIVVKRYETLHGEQIFVEDENEYKDSVLNCDASRVQNGSHDTNVKHTTKEQHDDGGGGTFSSTIGSIASTRWSSDVRLTPQEALNLSYIPWVLFPCNVSYMESAKSAERSASSTSSSSNVSTKLQGEMEREDSSSKPIPDKSKLHFPNWSYLSLRHNQNSNWVEKRLRKGVNHAKCAMEEYANINNKTTKSLSIVRNLLHKAEVCYKEGLEMIPHHVGILTAYGALCANDGRLEMASSLLQKAIRHGKIIDEKTRGGNFAGLNVYENAPSRIVLHEKEQIENVKNAEMYLDAVEKRMCILDDDATFVASKSAFVGKNKVPLNFVYQDINSKTVPTTFGTITNTPSKIKPKIALSNKAERALQDALTEKAFLTGNDPIIGGGNLINRSGSDGKALEEIKQNSNLILEKTDQNSMMMMSLSGERTRQADQKKRKDRSREKKKKSRRRSKSKRRGRRRDKEKRKYQKRRESSKRRSSRSSSKCHRRHERKYHDSESSYSSRSYSCSEGLLSDSSEDSTQRCK